MEAAGSFAALVISYWTKWHEIPEGSNLKKSKPFVWIK
jgi:hypothetical protein